MTEIALKTSDGLSLFARLSERPEKHAPVLILCHGMGEHSGRYLHVIRYFTERGFHVMAPDHRGHGQSDGPRGHTDSYRRLMEDVGLYIKTMADLYPGMPVFLYGHSMGGNLVLNYMLRHEDERLVGVVASAPYLKLAFEPPAWKVKMARLAAGLYPGLTQSTGLDTQAISRDPAVVEAYEKDPLVHDKITASFFLEVHEAGSWALSHADRAHLPVLLLHGTADRLTQAEASARFAQAAGEKATFIEYPGLYHELHNEPEKAQVLRDVANWLGQYTAILPE
ncbi:MAG: lysophospholipase [Flavobacteriales bacterium]|nr:lysophospholipase [Flavobacteriales bacterium]MDW8432668.1 alpha/beta hydrolase [Flavobacteriales bacterium]